MTQRHAPAPLVKELLPVIRRAVASRLRRRAWGRRRAAQEIGDMTQEVAVALFVADGGALRAWDPARGLGLHAFAEFLAGRVVDSLLRRRCHNPWTEEPAPSEAFDGGVAPGPGVETLSGSRRRLFTILARLRAQASPRDYMIFEMLISGSSPAEAAAAARVPLTTIYTVKSRLTAAARAIGATL